MIGFKEKFVYSIVFAGTALSIFIVASAYAQTQGIEKFNQSIANSSGQSPSIQNVSSIPIEKTILNALSEKTNVSMTQAIVTTEQAIGNNSKIISASLEPLNGTLVYKINALDNNSTMNRLIIDPGNGNILYKEKMDSKFYNKHGTDYYGKSFYLKQDGEYGCGKHRHGSLFPN